VDGGGDQSHPCGPIQSQDFSLSLHRRSRRLSRLLEKEWDSKHTGKPDAKAPAWLCAEDPDWKGNYKVRYWQPEWQAIILPRLDAILKAGFDGVYLDIVDGFEFLNSTRNGKTGLMTV